MSSGEEYFELAVEPRDGDDCYDTDWRTIDNNNLTLTHGELVWSYALPSNTRRQIQYSITRYFPTALSELDEIKLRGHYNIWHMGSPGLRGANQGAEDRYYIHFTIWWNPDKKTYRLSQSGPDYCSCGECTETHESNVVWCRENRNISIQGGDFLRPFFSNVLTYSG